MNTIKLHKTYREESHRCDVEQRKPYTEESVMYNSIYIKFRNRVVVTFGKEVIEGLRRGFWFVVNVLFLNLCTSYPGVFTF